MEFDAGEKEYSYDIGASDGAVLSEETDVRDSYETQTPSGTQTTEGQDTANQQNTAESSSQGDAQNVQVAVSQEDAKKRL